MKSSWEEIIGSELEYIDLIGYGSILNTASHEGDTSHPDTVLVRGFQRIYNLKMVPEWFCRKKLEAFMQKYWKKYDIHTMEQVDALDPKYCVLNAVYTGKSQDKLNGVLVRIPRKDFETYRKREEIYDLYKTHYSYIDPENGEISCCNKWGYILSAHEQYLIEDGYGFPPYHNFSREWAYNFGEYFGKMFEKTTKNVEKKKELW